VADSRNPEEWPCRGQTGRLVLSYKVSRSLAPGELPPLNDDIPTIGIVHGDLDSVYSRYAPILPSHCAEMPVAAWLMGHIHLPQKRPHRDGCILYPGSLQPLDPSERGVHGPWIVGIEASGVVEAHQLDLATVDYAVVDVDISSATDYEGIKPIVEQACYDYLIQAENERESVQHVTLRLRLTGRTALNAEIARSQGELTELTVEAERIVGTVDRVYVATRPVHDLERIAGSSPPGEVARMLLAMESGDFSEEQRRLLDRCVEQIGQIRSSSAYAGSPDEGADPRERAKEVLYRQGLALLDQIEDQKPTLQTPEQASGREQ
jgi:DNA repair protein SbcD/Mre11